MSTVCRTCLKEVILSEAVHEGDIVFLRWLLENVKAHELWAKQILEN